ncbi:ExbD/TolR family protein [Arcobacter arenosus]|uniref:Biopolymer transporter ExbD n=1 Tax=Arcobacter arenosus TaxID=2576037 RepID=A0A5R8XY65_9BACT|nr:biopolymer transporter ExbD [Arcobacter arenosus]TLP36280.1 biopolymer transporter ExbD [Arcobacter arenosus]
MKIKKYDSINVIPFIDVLLVLLAIVLMTSTFIAKGVIPVSLPKASSADNQKIKKELSIYIKNTGQIYLDKEELIVEELINRISEEQKDRPILINSDKDAKFEIFVSILDTLKSNEFENISIVTVKQQ